MKIALRRWSAFIPLLTALLAASCIVPETSTTQARAPSGPSKLSPANHTFDLEKEGLKRLWPQELGQLTSNRRLQNIYCAGRLVVVEAADGELHCLDARSGTRKTVVVLRDGLRRAPTAMGNTLFFVVGTSIYAYDTASEELGEPHNPGFALFTSPQVYQDNLVLAGGNGHLALLPVSGSGQQWLASLNGPIYEQPVISGAYLFAAAAGDAVIAWDLEHNRELWRRKPDAPSKFSSGVAVHGGSVYVGDGLGFLYAFQTEYGNPTWKVLLEAPIVGRPEVAGTKLLVLTDLPSLICVELGAERQVLWSYPGARRLLTTGNGTVYVLNEDHSVAALSLDTGQELWSDPLPRDCKIAGDPDRPVLYIANSRGSIVALAELD